MSIKNEITQANDKALKNMESTQTILVDVELEAKNVVPGLKDNFILHAGPPVQWNKMCGPMQGGIAGILVYEGRVNTWEEGYKLAASGEIIFSPNHDHNAVGPMIGVTSSTMPVFVLEDPKSKRRAYCTLNEGRGKVLRFGGFGKDVLERLNWKKESICYFSLLPTRKAMLVDSHDR